MNNVKEIFLPAGECVSCVISGDSVGGSQHILNFSHECMPPSHRHLLWMEVHGSIKRKESCKLRFVKSKTGKKKGSWNFKKFAYFLRELSRQIFMQDHEKLSAFFSKHSTRHFCFIMMINVESGKLWENLRFDV